MGPETNSNAAINRPARPFRRTVLRGVATVLPPLLTVVILIWAWNTIRSYVLDPLNTRARDAAAWYLVTHDVRHDLAGETAVVDGRPYARFEGDTYVPREVMEVVRGQDGGTPAAVTELYRRFVEIQYLRPHLVVPIFVLVFTLLMYLLGKFLAAGVGRFFWNLFEGMIQRLPFVRSVYSSVKQVTDMMFTEHEIKFLRVVAVQYPCKGVWAVAFVTGEGLQDISAKIGEPVLAVLIPTSPAPMTGFTAIVPKSEALELHLTLDQAIQFIVSCGVVVPHHQLPALTRRTAEPGPKQVAVP